jgi:mRNA-degrading endonuclease RelE of RelBE toxin-antitoxin system
MKSEINPDFIELFQHLPERVKRTARKNYRPRKDNPYHPRLEFKEVNQEDHIWSIRVGIGWRALGKVKDKESIVWFWIGSHGEYDKLLNKH